MKKLHFFPVVALLALLFVSCKPETEIITTYVNFEDVTLPASGVWYGQDKKGSFVSNGITFENKYIVSEYGDYWSGFACSSKIDPKAEGYGGDKQYHVVAGSGALGSKQFAIAYDTANVVCRANVKGSYSIKSLQLTNTSTAYHIIQKGSDYSRKFAANDWFKVIMKGYFNGTETGMVEYYLADFRNGRTFISSSLERVDVSALGKIDKLTFTFDSSDKGTFGVNTPKYVCVDNIELVQEMTK